MQEQGIAVDVVLVTYNSARIVRSALTNLPSWANPILVDNASSDNIEDVLNDFSVRLVRLEKNYGFGTACNRGAELGSAPFILFLNPDAQVEAPALNHLLTQLKRNSSWGAITPKICYADGTEFCKDKSFFEPELKPLIQQNNIREMPVLSGSVLLCKRDVFEKVGCFDENIFLFMEDDEISYRIRREGFTLISDRQVLATHLHGQSSGKGLSLERFKAFQEERSKIYVSKKHNIPYDKAAQLDKVKRRLLRAALMLDVRRVVRNWARLKALTETTGEL